MLLYRKERYLGAVGLLRDAIVKEQSGGLLQKPPRSGLVQLIVCDPFPRFFSESYLLKGTIPNSKVRNQVNNHKQKIPLLWPDVKIHLHG